MADVPRGVVGIDGGLLFPVTDDQVEGLIPDFCWAVGRAAAATVLDDGVLTVAEYEALADCAASLEGLSSFPGLMSFVILKGIGEDPKLDAALKNLKSATRDLPESVRTAIFEASAGLHLAQGDDAGLIRDRWAGALGVDGTAHGSGLAESASEGGRWLAAKAQRLIKSAVGRNPLTDRDPDQVVLDRATAIAAAYGDDDLAGAISRWRESEGGVSRADLSVAMAHAAERAYAHASARLKSRQDLQQQAELAGRFVQTAQALIDQVSSRLRSVEERLTLQSEMFREDLNSVIESSLDALEIEMGALMKGRANWTDPGIWETFKERSAYAALMVRFSPVRNRYTRLFDQWQRELDTFAAEAGTIRATVLSSVDSRAFAGLVPSRHSAASLKTALDRVSDATLGVSVMGVIGVGAAAAAGAVQATVVIAALANPVGATIGAVVGAAALWKAGSNIEGRKEKLVKDKRAQIREALERLLASEGLNHDELAGQVLTKSVEAAVEHYTPLIVEARLWAMKARLEPEVTERVLAGTRSFVALPDGGVA
jgi:hypothetical protein